MVVGGSSQELAARHPPSPVYSPYFVMLTSFNFMGDGETAEERDSGL